MAETNPNSRLEAFCDGVFAIALTLIGNTNNEHLIINLTAVRA